MDPACFLKTYIQPWVPIGAVILAYFLGRSAYFRQKEYELITRRYLDEGLDAISKNVDKSLAVFRHNWWQSTVVLKHFREQGKDMRKELYQNPFIAPDASLFDLWRDYRLNDIVGDDIFFRAHQSLDAFVRSSYAFFQDDLCAMVRLTIEGGKELEVNVSREQAITKYLDEIKKLDGEVSRYYLLLGELQELASIIQTERFSFQELKELRKRPQVIKTIGNLKKWFRDTLEVDETQQNREKSDET